MPAHDRVRRQRYTQVNSTGALPRAEREASGLRPSNLIQVMLAKGAHCGCGRHRRRRRRDRHGHRLAGGPLRAGSDAGRPRRRRPAGRRQGEPGSGGHAWPGLRVRLRRAGAAEPQPARHRPLPRLQPRAGRGQRRRAPACAPRAPSPSPTTAATWPRSTGSPTSATRSASRPSAWTPGSAAGSSPFSRRAPAAASSPRATCPSTTAATWPPSGRPPRRAASRRSAAPSRR